MVEEEKVVNAKELEIIKKDIDALLKKSKPLPALRKMLIRSGEDDLEERDKEIFNHIKNNPDIIKTDVIKAFNNKHGYSRVTTLRRIKRLDKEYHMIVARPDKANSQTHHLSVNYENELASLIVDLNSFKQAYFALIDKSNSIVNNKDIVFFGFIGLRENLGLVNALLTPLKLILNLYTTFDLFSSYEHLLDDVTVHTKFAAIYGIIKELQTKLYNSVFKEPQVKCDSFLVNTYLYDNLGFFSNILHSALLGSSYENIQSMLITFNKYGLREDAEVLLDCLWKIIYPIFLIIYPRYSKENPDVLRDWRKAIQNFRDFDTRAQVLEYKRSIAESAL